MGGKTVMLLVGGGVVGLVVTIVLLSSGGGAPSYGKAVAAELPRDTIIMGALAKPEVVLQAVGEHLPEKHKAALTKALGADFSDSATFVAAGFDLGSPMGFGFLDVMAESVCFSAGLRDATRAKEWLKAKLPKLLADAEVPLEEWQVGGHSALIVAYTSDPAGFLFKGDRVLLVAGDRLRKTPGTDGKRQSNDLNGLERALMRLASLAENDSLLAAEGLEKATAIPGADLALGFFNLEALRSLWSRFGEGGAAFAMLQDLRAIGAGVGVSGETRVEIKTLFAEGSRILRVFDTDAPGSAGMQRIPGPVLMGANARLDPQRTLELVESFVAMDRRASRDYGRMQEELRKELGIDFREAVLNTTGETGAVLGRLATRERGIVPYTAYHRVKDVDKAGWLLETLMARASDTGLEWIREEVGEARFYLLRSRWLELSMAVALHEDVLWFSTSANDLREVIRGGGKAYLDTERGGEVGAVVKSGAQVAAFWDAKAFFEQLPFQLSRRERRHIEPFLPALGELDRAELTIDRQDDTLVIVATVPAEPWPLLGKAGQLDWDRLFADPCQEVRTRCATLKKGQDMCLMALEMAEKAGKDACRAFVKGFEQARQAWESMPDDYGK